MNNALNVLSAGAAKGLLHTISREAGIEIQGEFGAVGAMRERLSAGAPCDVIVLTDAMIAQLAAEKIVRAESITPLGVVQTGVAQLQGAPAISVNSAATLKAALSAATRIYFPDPERATAGIHMMKVLTALGLAESHRARFATYPNGASAMRAMADAGDSNALGVTQASEIMYTEGVRYVGALPGEFALSTGYSAALVGGDQARSFLNALSDSAYAKTRLNAGFELR